MTNEAYRNDRWCPWEKKHCGRTIECVECELFPDNKGKKNFTAEPRKVAEYEYGCAMCPSCGEPLYEVGRCVFCGQRYIDERKQEPPTLRGAHFTDEACENAVCDKCGAASDKWRFVAHGDGPKMYQNIYNCECGQSIAVKFKRYGGMGL